MIYKLFSPSILLQEYILRYHLLHFDLKGLSIGATRTYVPRAEQCLTFDIRGRVISLNKDTGETQYRSRSYLSQQQISTYDLSLSKEYIMLKVVFQPGALYRLYGIPLCELGERYVDAEQVAPAEMRMVNEQLANAASYTEMIETVERYLVHKIKTIKRPRHPVDSIGSFYDALPVPFSLDMLATNVCMSARQLERKFLERIGVSPALYHRIHRFNYAFHLKENQPSLSWLAVAIQSGYTDLQHLIKDFKRFSGTTPSILITQEANHIAKRLKLV